MGREKGEAAANRSKSRASSSSLAASLVSSSSAAVTVGFGGYIGSSRFDTDNTTAFLDIDGEVAQQLKRIGRKDPTTKLKALQTLSALFKEKSGKELVLIIPQWGYEYKKLLLDYNREVRRATNETMTNLVTAVGRDLAPYLKSLMGPWWFSQFDSVPEVSLAAKRSLEAAFPAQEKRLDALILCTSEIFMYLEENLKHTPQSMSSDKVTALDELEEMHQQVISSSLLALATLLDVLVCMQSERPGFENITSEPKHASKARETAISFGEKLFSTQKYFLDFLKSKTPAIRCNTWCFSGKGSYLSFINVGCNVSYPALVILLDILPPKAISGEKFFIDFFQNLWDGRNPSNATNPDRLAFFYALKECFLWGLCNASRICDDSDSTHHFQVSLVDNILVKLLWQEYLFSVSLKNQYGVISEALGNSLEHGNLPFHHKAVEPLKIKYSRSYFQELGKCIVEILSGVYLLEHDLLSTFSVVFKENCLRMFQPMGNTESTTENVEQVIKFLSLLEKHSLRKGENWPLVDIVGPMLAKSFPLIRSLDTPDGVRLLSVAVSLFGPQKIVQELHIYNEANSSYPDHKDKELRPELFMQVFEGTFVPWCLLEYNSSTSARLDLLLALLNDEYFSAQWQMILSYAINQEKSQSEPGPQDVHYLDLSGPHPDEWQHELLESAAVAVACSPSPHVTSAQFFVCGPWWLKQRQLVVRDSCALLVGGSTTFNLENESSINKIETAQFALKVLGGSFFCLNTVSNEIELVSGILTLVFIIGWENSLDTLEEDVLNDESKEKIKGRLRFDESLNGFCSKMNDEFWKSLGIDNRKRLGSNLVHFIRSVIFKEDKLGANKITALCFSWVLEVFECLCHDHYEEQNLLDQLLSKNDTWPVWIIPDFSTPKGLVSLNAGAVSVDIYATGNLKFVSLVDKLILKIGINRVIAGYVENTLSPPLKETTKEEITSRAWLAAEILCTWKWPGGSAVASFLPLLSAGCRSGNYPLQESLLDSIFNILLDGALVHGESGTHSSFNLWPAFGDELEKVEEPFLRALLSLLVNMFKENLWEGDKAIRLFDLLTHKLFIGEAVNQNCLKILPAIVSVLVRPLCLRSIESEESSSDYQVASLGEKRMQDTVKEWLRRILSFPPLVTWQAGQDMEEWFQLVIVCYPLSAMNDTKSLKLVREISPEERILILDVFRKQRLGVSALVASNQLPLFRILLSKLMVLSVGYCWTEFTEEDWEFFFSNLRSWIQSAVVIMEEVTENVNDLITNSSTSENFDVLKNLEKIVLIPDPYPITVAINALASFSLFCAILELQQPADDTPLITERWDSTRDRILEGILRLFFCTGIAESIASSYSVEAASIVAANSLFLAILEEDTTCSLDGETSGDRNSGDLELSSERNIHLKEELSLMIEKLPDEAFEVDLISQERVNVFLAWSLLLSHLWSLSSSSSAREQLVQYVQDSANSLILDCLFQHIPLELCLAHNLKKKDLELPADISEAASAVKTAITTGSLLFSIETLWPIEPKKMTSLAGALFGLMLRILPAYVRGWFTDLRDRTTSSLIESFTRTWCSPPLIVNELSQIKKANFADENFSVSVSKSANEVVATYMKDETGMDLVIRLPPSYPLRPVDVECMRSLGISEVKQRKWLMSMMLFVRNQNGALAEAIQTWKSNFDKEFEGVEECPICYSVIHTTNHSLPRLACRTCKHKFHSACLYKWFSTSHKSSCPLCQSPF
ncbi:ZINC FINGER PROTEIN 294 [Salix purpurea]|uniref:E3 ubiquitin-protein ligase listerin n=1 Tax=Salix purpurea TaxID=77065 RepID=A0A9Q0ZSG2_SALPP|nr:ZINC FINGER PROTEIN 294 [Salix purpurea]